MPGLIVNGLKKVGVSNPVVSAIPYSFLAAIIPALLIFDNIWMLTVSSTIVPP